MKKKFTVSEKVEVLSYFRVHGVTKASREFGISTVSIYKWRDQFEEQGQSGLADGKARKEEEELKALRRENALLKKLLAESELRTAILDSLQKKTQ